MIHRPKNNAKNGYTVPSPSPKKSETHKSSSKVLASAFWNKDGILLVDNLEKGAPITAKHCVAFVNKLKQRMASKRGGKFSKGILYQDNADSHKAAITHQKLIDRHSPL
jgi:hypothetical protein